MLTDSWDIAHIAVAVPDLQEAIEHYETVYGVKTWGPMIEFSGDTHDAVSPLYGPGASMAGGRQVWSLDGAAAVAAAAPYAPLELCQADRYTPAFSIYGCPDDRWYVHHLAFWVDDLEAESANLIQHGYALELTIAPGDKIRGFGYHLAPNGDRIELMSSSDKDAIGHYLQGGELQLDWASAS